MSVTDTLFQLFKGANPEATDEDIQNQIGSLNLESADSVLSPFEVAVSDTTATAPIEPPAAQAPFTTGTEPAPELASQTDKILSGLNEQAVPTTPSPLPVAAPEAPKAPPALAATPEEPAAPVEVPSSDDFEKRKAFNEEEKKRENLSLIPTGLAGIGDAIGSAASAFGAKGKTDGMETVERMQKESAVKRQADFEKQLKSDPNSSVSKAYRNIILQIVPEMEKQANFQKMTALEIGEKLPFIDTMMKARAAKDAKEIMLEQAKSNREISLGVKETQNLQHLRQKFADKFDAIRNDRNISRLEEQRDAAAQAYNLLNQKKDQRGNFDLSEPQMVELYGQIFKALNGNSLTQESLKIMNQKTIKSELAKMETFFGASPSAVTRPIGERLLEMADTVGKYLQGNLDKRMAARAIPDPDLLAKDPDYVREKTKAGRGMTYQELIEESNKRRNQGMSSTVPSSATPANPNDPLAAKKAQLRQKLGI